MVNKLILVYILISNLAFAARLEDVRVLDGVPSRNGLKLKLQLKDGPKDSYFLVEITKADPAALEKTGRVVEKLLRRDQYKLDLSIPSFSASPSGSYYRSESVTFIGARAEQ